MKTRSAILLFGDIILSMLAIPIGYMLRFGESLPSTRMQIDLTHLALFVFVIVFSSFLLEIYNSEKRIGKKELLLKILIVLSISFFLIPSLYYVLYVGLLWKSVFVMSLGVFGFSQFFWHVGYDALINSPGLAQRVLIIGVGQLAKKIGEVIASTNHNQFLLKGYVNLASEPVYVPLHAIVGNGDSGYGLAEVVKKEKAHKLVISLSERRGVFPLKDVLNCKFSGIEVIDAPSFYEEVTGKLLIENITPSWFIFSDGFKLSHSMKITKRIVDIILSLIGLMISLPLFPIIAFAIRANSKGQVFFKQVRVGESEKNFVLYKFRTMRQDAESKTGAVWAQKNDPRVTMVGRFLRKTRIDEIPQLFNVLKGDMSFIGPRPERPEFVEELKSIIPYYSERHFVKPGITGWAQIRYPYGASVEDAIEKLRYDLYYIKNISPFRDMLIVIETIKVILFGRGAR